WEQRLSLPFGQRVTSLCPCKEKVTKRNTAGREPMRLRRISPLRSSRGEGTAHNSLRSDMCASAPLTPLRCSARSTAGEVKSWKQPQPQPQPQPRPLKKAATWVSLLRGNEPSG